MTTTRITATRVICSACRHPRPLHSSEGTGCMAKGCHAGPDETPCTGFVDEPLPAVLRDAPASAYVIPQPVFREAV